MNKSSATISETVAFVEEFVYDKTNQFLIWIFIPNKIFAIDIECPREYGIQKTRDDHAGL